MHEKNAHTRHLATLDGMRGIAAIAIVLYHVAPSFPNLGFDQFPHGYLAVDFFFILSGYVIAKAYEAKLTNTLRFPDYVKLRLIRIYPALLVGILISVVILIVKMFTAHNLTAWQLLTATLSAIFLIPTTSLQALFPTIYPINPPSWSLFFELAVNFIHAALARWLTTTRLALLCAFLAFGLFYVAYRHKGVNVGWSLDDFLYGFVRVGFSFTAGILIFRLSPAFRLGNAASIILFALLATILFYPWLKECWVFDIVMVTFVFPALIVATANCKNDGWIKAVFLLLGTLSYPLYVLHQPVIEIFKSIKDVSAISDRSLAVLCVLTCFAFSYICLKLWDEWVRRYLSKRFYKR